MIILKNLWKKIGFLSFSAGLSIMIGIPSSLVLLSLFGGGSLVIGLSFVLMYIKVNKK